MNRNSMYGDTVRWARAFCLSARRGGAARHWGSTPSNGMDGKEKEKFLWLHGKKRTLSPNDDLTTYLPTSNSGPSQAKETASTCIIEREKISAMLARLQARSTSMCVTNSHCCICVTSGQTWDERSHPENQLTGTDVHFVCPPRSRANVEKTVARCAA